MKYEKDLEILTRNGHVDTSDVVLFMKELGILNEPNHYQLFHIFLTVAHHNGYKKAMEDIIEIQKESIKNEKLPEEII